MDNKYVVGFKNGIDGICIRARAVDETEAKNKQAELAEKFPAFVWIYAPLEKIEVKIEEDGKQSIVIIK